MRCTAWQHVGHCSDVSACVCGIVCARVCMQVRTALNMLGPLLNPADAEYGLVGVYSPDISELMANSLLVSMGEPAAG